LLAFACAAAAVCGAALFAFPGAHELFDYALHACTPLIHNIIVMNLAYMLQSELCSIEQNKQHQLNGTKHHQST
jgi:histidinol-phosphate/aromatic aminotransferase/cobyric acid decarboxylase-like protein